MSQKKARQSGLELLRIIAMLLIIAHHYSIHGGFPSATSENVFAAENVFLQMILLFGRPACSLFVLISGFFLVKAGSLRAHYKKLGSLCGAMIFYGVAFLVLAICVLRLHVDKQNIASSFLPFAGHNWFVVFYIALYLLIPFINPLLRAMSPRRYAQFVAVLLVCWSLIPSLNIVSKAFNGVWSFGSFDFFLVMYVLGAYIRLHIHGKVRYSNRWNLIVALGMTLLIALSALGIDFLAHIMHRDSILSKITKLRQFNFAFCVIWAVSLFLYFSNLNIESRAINRVASATLGVYLIHDHPLGRSIIWQNISPNANYAAAPYLHALIKILAVFLVCTAIELLRAATIGKWFDRWFGRVYDRAVARLDARRQRKREAAH